MNKIYLITGPAGVGKSTISKKIAESLKNSVLIEGYDIYHLVVGGHVSPWKKGNHLNFFWKNCKSIISNSLEEGYDVVFNYIFDKKQVNDIKKSFGKNVQIKFVCLMVDENTLLDRDKERPADCQMGERCLVLLNDFRNKQFNIKNILDTSKLSEKETFEEVVQNNKYII